MREAVPARKWEPTTGVPTLKPGPRRSVRTRGKGTEMTRKPKQQIETARFVALCDRAADHIANAHKALYRSPEAAERAIAQLDAALDCLRGCDSRA